MDDQTEIRPPVAVRRYDRARAPYRDDPVVAALTDDELAAVAALLAQLARSAARRADAGGAVTTPRAG